MARLFDIVGTDITIDANVVAIPALQKIWDRDKSKEKEQAIKELKYITFLCDFLSPYKDLVDSLKSPTIIKDIFKDNWVPDNDIKEAIEKYNELQQTPNMRLLLSAKRTVDKLSDYFDTIDFNEVDNFGKSKYSAKDLSSNLKDVGQIVKSLSMLERQVQTELAEKNVRGNSEIGPYELPKTNTNAQRSQEERIDEDGGDFEDESE